MARSGGRLSPRRVATALPRPGRRATLYADGLNLYLQTTLAADGSVRRSWVFRYEHAGRRRDMGIGATHTVSLAEARLKARELRQRLLDGVDPLLANQARQIAAKLEAARAVTFRDAASQYIAAHEGEWRSTEHRSQWIKTLAYYAYPTIGNLPVADIDLPLVLKVIEPHWQTKRETMSRVRGRIAAVLDWATVRGYRTGDNPAQWRGRLEHVLPAVNKAKQHHAAMVWRDVPAFLAALREKEGVAACALEFAILTAARTGEALEAQWSEIELDARVWSVPASRMKSGREHRVPLSHRAIELLRALPRQDGNDFVFAGEKAGRPLSNKVLLRLVKRAGLRVTPHGFRSSFRDWAAECTNYPREVCEAALAHRIPDTVERSYLRGSFMQKRARLMDEWARFCAAPPMAGEIVPLHRSGDA